MIDLLKIIFILIFIIIMVRLKWNIGYVLIAASGLLAVMYLMPPLQVVETAVATVTDPTTISFFFALTLIRVLEMIMREKQIMSSMMHSAKKFLRHKKAVIISMPLLIGMLPSLGGAYFSAPMVDESTKNTSMRPEEKAFVNYWYRHPWEYILPMYPGILLAAALTGLKLGDFILVNMPYALLIFATGFLFSMRGVKSSASAEPGQKTGIFSMEALEAIANFLPVLAILVMVMGFHVELQYAMAVVIAALYIFYKFGIKDIFRTLVHGFAVDVIILIFGTMFFKFMMEASGAVAYLSQYFASTGIPLMAILFALPFVTGIITGITVGFVGGTFPLLISIAGGAHLNEMTFAFASGFAGVLMSPVHLCLVLTREYFKADVWEMYKKIIPGCAIILAVAAAMYFAL
ncbi:MAG: DUF401 family protein [Nitrospiraceae bacterium]|nr:DUF401 family protein [Nitrospiraceae bacterium]MCE5312909.1 DUF401 family protein [Nitrospiraceae bacterium]